METVPLETDTTDTIAAIATPLARGALGIVRLSGAAAIPICDKVFRGRLALTEAQDRSVVLGEIVGRKGDPIDQVLVLVMRRPQTPTGEDVVEITCHGGILVPRLILKQLVDQGARSAEPGEFTKRAFLNGKLDLAQAEAVEEIVRASSEKALAVAIRQLKGELSRELGALEQQLCDWLALIEANIDFVEDEIDAVDGAKLAESLRGLAGNLQDLLAAHDRGKYLRDALDVVIVGKPNVGKSSLFNKLVGRDRVIVSDVPGTTRDVVDGLVGVDGVVIRLHDTAGVRRVTGGVEEEAVRRTLQAIDGADVALVVLDASERLTAEDQDVLDGVSTKPRMIVANKSDLDGAGTWEQIWSEASAKTRGVEATVRVSALEGWGVSELIERLGSLARERIEDVGYEIVVNERHAGALRETLQATLRAAGSVDEGRPLELVASDIRCALQSVGEVTGRRVASEVLEAIFSRFCIGK